MNWLDIIIIVIIAWAGYQGYKEGIVTQVSGIVAVFVGAYLAIQLNDVVAQWLNIYGTLGNVIGFILIFIIVVLLLAFLGRLLSGLFRFSGLGILPMQ